MEKGSMTPEMLAKAKAAASAEELTRLAKAHGIALEAREAREFFAALHKERNGELNDADLDGVAGGLLLDPEASC